MIILSSSLFIHASSGGTRSVQPIAVRNTETRNARHKKRTIACLRLYQWFKAVGLHLICACAASIIIIRLMKHYGSREFQNWVEIKKSIFFHRYVGLEDGPHISVFTSHDQLNWCNHNFVIFRTMVRSSPTISTFITVALFTRRLQLQQS